MQALQYDFLACQSVYVDCYCSIGALLKDGVIVRTSNLVTPGAVEVGAQTLRGSAARIAARKHSAFHVKRQPDDST